MCLCLFTESVVCTCIHVHLHAQEPVDVNACVCTACGRQRLVRAISLNICPHSVLGQGMSLIWNSPDWLDWLPSQPQRSSCVCLHELEFQACAKAWSLYTTAGDSWGYELGFLCLGSKCFTGRAMSPAI